MNTLNRTRVGYFVVPESFSTFLTDITLYVTMVSVSDTVLPGSLTATFRANNSRQGLQLLLVSLHANCMDFDNRVIWYSNG
jgi:hypothetical protein